MAFVPRLPTWNTEVTCYSWDAGGSVYVEGDTVVGQIYTPYRNQASDSEVGEVFFEFPIENWGCVRDPCQSQLLTPDAISFEFPAGSENILTYHVVSVAPRWCNFPNQHVIAELVCGVVDTGGGGGDPCAYYVSFSSDLTSNTADDISPIVITVNVQDASHVNVVGATVTLSDTGTGITISPSDTGTTDGSGNIDFSLTSLTEQIFTTSALVNDCSIPFEWAVELGFTSGGGGGGGVPCCSCSFFEFPDGDGAAPGDIINIAITVRDTDGNPVDMASVTLNYSGNTGTVTVSGSPGTSDSLGHVNFGVSCDACDIFNLTAHFNGVDCDMTEQTVFFTVGC